MKTCFSAGKLMKVWKPHPFLKEPPSQLTPLFLSNFFMTPLCPNFKNQTPPPLILRGGGGGNYDTYKRLPALTSIIMTKLL